ncbi:MAG: hypothetical protein Q9186_007418 [Xanthomendoza sp. 1 TL-2023]
MLSNKITDETHQKTPDQEHSPPSVQHQESIIQNAFSIDQSQLVKSPSTSPQHPRINAVINSSTNSPSTTTPATQGKETPILPSSQPLSSAQGSYFSNQPGSSGTEARSPANRRAPASRSSHGIPTANGPPPALITQRSYHGDPWRNPTPTELTTLPPTSHQPSQTKESGSLRTRKNSTNSKTSGGAKLGAMNGNGFERDATSTAPSYRQRHVGEDDDTLRTYDGTSKSHRHHGNGSNGLSRSGGQEDDQSYSSHEDLFLHLARADAEASNVSDSAKKTGRRGSEIGLSTSQPVHPSRQLGIRPASSGQDISGGLSEDKISRWSRSSQLDTPMKSRYSSPRDQQYAASAHPLDSRSQRYLHSELSPKPSMTTPRVRNHSNQESSPELPASSGRRQSIAESRSGARSRTYKPAAKSHVLNHLYDSSPIAQEPWAQQSIHPDDTESTISTTAPSTVWDELDDLKSRIHKLELTGKLPSSSGAAMARVANDRPRTATTTMTTASSSPRDSRPRNTSPEASTVKGTDTLSLHPLLHSALAKTKPLIDPMAYKALDATASDALTLAAMTGAAKSSGLKTQDTPRAVDRQLRRKADNMCRSLTELCIALSEEKTSISNTRTGSNEDDTVRAPPLEDPPQLRAPSQDPDRPSSRIISRLEARRTSLLASKTPPFISKTPNHSSTDSQQYDSSSALEETLPSSRTDRPSFLHRRRTADSNADTVTLTSRPTSRTTDQRPSPATRISREYTSQHPLPTLSNIQQQSQQQQRQRSPSIQSSSVKKSSYFPYYASNSNSNSNNNNSPSASQIQPGGRRYLSAERQTPPMSAEEIQNREAERQRRIASLGQYSSGRRLRLVEGEQE